MEQIVHHKKKNTDFVAKASGPMERYIRWHRNWPCLLTLLVGLLLPSIFVTFNLLRTKGVNIAGDTKERLDESPFLSKEEQHRIKEGENGVGGTKGTFPSQSIILKRVKYAREYNNNALVCELKDRFSIIMECPIQLPNPTPSRQIPGSSDHVGRGP